MLRVERGRRMLAWAKWRAGMTQNMMASLHEKWRMYGGEIFETPACVLSSRNSVAPGKRRHLVSQP